MNGWMKKNNEDEDEGTVIDGQTYFPLVLCLSISSPRFLNSSPNKLTNQLMETNSLFKLKQFGR